MVTSTEIELQIKDAIATVQADLISGKIGDNEFDMTQWFTRVLPGCGSIGCIGGWTSHYLQERSQREARDALIECAGLLSEDFENRLNNLFFNFTPGATRAQAIVAIQRFREGFDDPWHAD